MAIHIYNKELYKEVPDVGTRKDINQLFEDNCWVRGCPNIKHPKLFLYFGVDSPTT